MMRTSKNPISAKGRVFPRISSAGRMGETKSCSMVPISRSRTMAMAVIIIRVSMMRMAMTQANIGRSMKKRAMADPG